MGARVFLCGYYGFGNTGDEVILAGVAGALQGVWPGVELVVTSGGKPLAVPAQAVAWRDVAAIRAAVAAADLVVVGGGGLFADYWGVNPAALGTPDHHGVTFYSWPLLLAAERGIPALVWGVGVGPLTSPEGRELVARAFSAAAWVSVRDRLSAQLVRELGYAGELEVVPDAAWAAPPQRCDRAAVLAELGLPAEAALVAVAVRRWPRGDIPGKATLLGALRQAAQGRRLGVVLVPFHLGEGRDDDHGAARELADELSPVVPSWVVPGSWGPQARFWLCAAADLTVGMRLHACLAALRGGRVPLGLAYDPKVTALFAEVGEGRAARKPEEWDSAELAHEIVARLAQPVAVGARTKEWQERSPRPAAVAGRLVAGGRGAGRGGAGNHGRTGAMEVSRAALQRRLDGILASHRQQREVVLFLPSVFWRTEVFQRPNQLALALAQAGCLVFYWEPPSSPHFGPGFHRLARRLYVANVPPETFAALPDPLVVGLPYNVEWQRGLGAFRLVYDVIDHLDVFPGGSAALAAPHAAMLQEATAVAVVSRPLLAEVQRVRPDALYLPNAADPAAIRRHLAAGGGPTPRSSGVPKRAGYFGSFAAWVDYDLLEALVESSPELELRLVGPDLDGSLAESGLAEHPRVRYLGPQPYTALHGLCRDLRVALIPFLVNDITAAVSPLKLYEYLAMELPVVSVDLPECRDVPGVWIAGSQREFVALVEQLSSKEVEAPVAAARAAFVAANTWAHRAEALLAHLATVPPREVPRRHVTQLAQGLAAAAVREEEGQRALAEAREELATARRQGEESAARERELVRRVEEAAARERELVRRVEEAVARERELVRRVEAAAAREQELARQHAELVACYGERQAEVERLATTLARLTATRWMRLASWYWRTVGKLRGSAASGPAAPTTGAATAARAAVQPSLTSSAAAGGGASEQAEGNFSAAVALTSPPADGQPDYLVFPIIDWDFRFQRPQQLACGLAARGHRVFFAKTTFRRWGQSVALEPKRERIWEVSLRGPARSVYRDALTPAEVEEIVAGLETLRREQGLGATALLVELPFWWPVAEVLRQRWGAPVVYDCMDYHPGFSTNDAAMLELEDRLVAGADLVVVSSRYLEQHMAGRARRLVRLPNGCDFVHFAQVSWRPAGNPLTVGYYGAIADWFDSQLVGQLARLRPDWRFLLVGSTYTCDTAPLAGCDNVELVGERPYTELPQWLERMDVLLIPFRRTPLTEATNPVKFFEIMAAGKPLVAVPLPELAPFGELVAFAETAEEFAHRIAAAAAADSAAHAETRRAFARQHTWQARVAVLAPAVAESFPLASVVVVTHNNLPLTQACLDSVLSRTEWPNFEVIVVDNGSRDGTQDFLAQLAAADPRLKVIANPDNRGFAAANNQGLRQAKGEFLVLLNNDTVVVRGWLAGLIRHLCSHPEWGVVGPVTNWIGNEAQIPVGYTSLAELPTWAAQHCREHDGKYFSIPVLAMFCLAMRRATFERVGELDERFGVGMFEDDDYALRVRQAGLEVVCVEDVFVHHEGKATFRRLDETTYAQLFAENRRKFEEKWGRPWVPHRYRGQ